MTQQQHTAPVPRTAASRHLLSRMAPRHDRGKQWIGIDFETEQQWRDAIAAIEAESAAGDRRATVERFYNMALGLAWDDEHGNRVIALDGLDLIRSDVEKP